MRTTNLRMVRTRGGAVRRGFTLIEAICTIVVLVAVLPPLVEGFTLAARTASRARQRAEATALARSVMDRMISTGEWQNGSVNGTETQPKTGLQYEWEVSLSDWEEATSQSMIDLEQMDVTVHWTFEGVPEQVALSTVVYIPDTTITTTGTTGGTGAGGGGGGLP